MSDIIRLAHSRLYKRWAWRITKLVFASIALYFITIGGLTIMQRAIDAHIIKERVTQRVTLGRG